MLGYLAPTPSFTFYYISLSVVDNQTGIKWRNSLYGLLQNGGKFLDIAADCCRATRPEPHSSTDSIYGVNYLPLVRRCYTRIQEQHRYHLRNTKNTPFKLIPLKTLLTTGANTSRVTRLSIQQKRVLRIARGWGHALQRTKKARVAVRFVACCQTPAQQEEAADTMSVGVSAPPLEESITLDESRAEGSQTHTYGGLCPIVVANYCLRPG